MSKGKKKPEVDPVDLQIPDLTGREYRHYQEIRSLEATCERLEGDYETAKAAASAAKGMWLEAVSRLRESIRRGPDPQLALPLVDDYMQTFIGKALTLTEKQEEAFEECGIYTVQDFEDLRAGDVQDMPGGITDLPGIGKATADKWENEVLDWLADQRMRAADGQADDLKEDSDAVA